MFSINCTSVVLVALVMLVVLAVFEQPTSKSNCKVNIETVMINFIKCMRNRPNVES